MKRFFFIFALLICLAPLAARAVVPDEMLANSKLEKRAEAIDASLRCPVCQGESIADSNAELAHDLRLLVRQRLLKGDSDGQVVQYIVARYGDFVLMKPPLDKDTIALWAGPTVILLLAALAGWRFLRTKAPPAKDLSQKEKDLLSRLEREEGGNA